MKIYKFISVLLFLLPLAPTRADSEEDIDSVVTLLEFVIDVDDETARECLATLRRGVESGELRGERLETIRKQFGNKLGAILAQGPQFPLHWDAALLAAAWGDAAATELVRSIAVDSAAPQQRRLAAFNALAAARDTAFLAASITILQDDQTPTGIASRLLGALGSYETPQVAQRVLPIYHKLPPDVKPKAIALLIQRAVWSRQLLEAIGDENVPANALNVNQVRQLLASPDKQLAALVRKEWGAVRTERNPAREQVIRDMNEQFRQATGNPHRGQRVFHKVCGQCHKIYGAGQDVGPEITRNGRNNFEQLLSNVFDPSLVIGASYQARTVITIDGRVLTGLLAENNAQRIVLKTQGGKTEVIPRDQVDEVAISKLSLMPEGVEKQLKPQELVDLFAFLVLDQPPSNPDAALISGAPKELVGE